MNTFCTVYYKHIVKFWVNVQTLISDLYDIFLYFIFCFAKYWYGYFKSYKSNSFFNLLNYRYIFHNYISFHIISNWFMIYVLLDIFVKR